jgi:hypothetical protein
MMTVISISGGGGGGGDDDNNNNNNKSSSSNHSTKQTNKRKMKDTTNVLSVQPTQAVLFLYCLVFPLYVHPL